MEIKGILFETFDLENITPEVHEGATGIAWWKIITKGNVRMRIVEYSQGYLADHWCEKGHAVYVLEGEFTTELKDGRKYELKKGMGYLVADKADAHRSLTRSGVKLLIVD